MELGLSCSSFSPLIDGKYVLNTNLFNEIKEQVPVKQEEGVDVSSILIKGLPMLKS